MAWLSDVFSYLKKRNPLLPLAVLCVWLMFCLDLGGLLTFVRDQLHEAIQIRNLYWYFFPWHLIWLIWSLDAVLGSDTRMNRLCPELEKLLYCIEGLDIDSEDRSKRDYDQFFIQACKIRHSLNKLKIPNLEVACLSKDCPTRVVMQAWRKFLVKLIPLAIEKNYQLAQELLSNELLLETLNFNDEERNFIANQILIPPKNLKTSVGEDRVTLKWDRSSCHATGYQILRCCPSKGEKQLQLYVTNTGSTDTSYVDEDTTQGEKYAYSVRSINKTSLSKSSNKVKTKIPVE